MGFNTFCLLPSLSLFVSLCLSVALYGKSAAKREREREREKEREGGKNGTSSFDSEPIIVIIDYNSISFDFRTIEGRPSEHPLGPVFGPSARPCRMLFPHFSTRALSLWHHHPKRAYTSGTKRHLLRPLTSRSTGVWRARNYHHPSTPSSPVNDNYASSPWGRHPTASIFDALEHCPAVLRFVAGPVSGIAVRSLRSEVRKTCDESDV